MPGARGGGVQNGTSTAVCVALESGAEDLFERLQKTYRVGGCAACGEGAVVGACGWWRERRGGVEGCMTTLINNMHETLITRLRGEEKMQENVGQCWVIHTHIYIYIYLVCVFLSYFI